MARYFQLTLCALLFALGCTGVRAQDDPQVDPQTEQQNAPRELAARSINLLSFIAVDYPEAVADGAVRDPQLYRQLRRYAERVGTLLQQLPERPGRSQLDANLAELSDAIEQLADPDRVRRRANGAADRIAALYQLPRSPLELLPEGDEAAAVYRERCSHCHGARGEQANTGGSDLDSRERMARFSLYDLYNTIDPARDDAHGQAIDGDLSSRQRWALAVLIAGFSAPPQAPPQALAEKYPALVALPGLAVTRPSELPQEAAAALIWWRAHPEYTRRLQHPLARAAGLIQLAQTSYRGGDSATAYHQLMLALREGFAPARLPLEERDAPLANQLDQQWRELREAILGEAPSNEVIEKFQRLQAAVLRAREALQPTPKQGLYGWSALLFAAALLLGGLLWWGLRRHSRRD
ncbi:hypothetical protein [uncultured Microbulbifer sp.]|mgnify:CR=1 FL=1|uniref:hypothetical protein n=1 Tax=uncultured Microbulbifer sp. TaxID=348147 RepID=UPI0025FDF2DF|nr:hypothetical protein [uncultured Microbulbifer sp.]